ncbi:MAG: hypothetical protein A2667_02545 [Candidatus Wildermuthbacteria bacterium RIFCSPHIGHO2_01_FULL_47_27]|uniref:Uncharacterized protein n=2 Tax=Candidatus Wildermuthiibacteriota TaxID=1817923 RepID=A0A1G2RMR5_9BACT|nr:MAG: hypothetical protein UY15_C0005G0006 [Parcubacteria group bacterium GW2011_GWA2_47_9]OHA63607.1 MAG: hypothetical protein A2667_02545 [Candidatus Wildermuthbacteria bacterium RIFCSPHIGHO2_01_FULL_47_27]OHA68284.1 MAG: hypothetical protein A3D59_03950 [Candidatus Wildermuthbacteria bacterium RIFCSPHIGHO2_02_FULL_47_17]OHA74143.1 MAG: hypothetical protein A3A32_00415 [Candidatus Wildermuthbacteria bacterium RIFCSPLOWO2_01_FULL_48_35]OHA75988.1 MAG: hypothetical protein A3I38_03085 [Candid
MLIKIKVFPESKNEEVVAKTADSFEVRIKEKAERGLANKAVITALAAYFNIPEANVRLVKGFTQRNKIFDIRGVQT